METLPSELIMEILLLLPVKSLCRFRCVSKSWLALVNDHYFVKMHLARTGTRSQRLVLTAGSPFSSDVLIPFDFDDDLYSKSLYSVDLSGDGNNFVPVEMDFPFRKENQGRIWIMGSCNGLLCIMPQKDEFYVFNPCTRECKLIPDFDQPRLGYASGTQYGFGFAKLVDDYKFVKIACDRRFVQVYSLRNDSWKSILIDVDINYIFYTFDKCKVCLNGAIHWVCSNVEDQSVIVAFDLVEEKFKMLPVPDSASKLRTVFSVGLLSDWLCLIPEKLWLHQWKFWVMKDYGVKESWTRISLAGDFGLLRPLCLLKKSGRMLCLTDRMLLLCDPEDGNVECVTLNGSSRYQFHGHVYVESLVSPNYDNHFKSKEKLLQYWF